MRTSIKPAALLLLSPSRSLSHGPVRRTPTRPTFPDSNNSLRIPVLDSPLPSPSLPSIVPRHGKRTSPRWRRRARRLLVWFVLTVVVLWACLSALRREVVHFQYDGGISLPSTPGPTVVGRSKWTVYIPPDTSPLPPGEYARILAESISLSQTLRPRTRRFLSKDPSYIDIHDAQAQNLLPPSSSTSSGNVVNNGIYSATPVRLPPCTSSLTFLLQAPSAALGPTLLALWLSYGFAQRTNRAFFIDESNWAYGAYTTYFRAPPMPACRPVPVSQRVPYPETAAHLVVSEETAGAIFGAEFHEYFQGKKERKNGIERKPVFDMLRAGYDALFHLKGADKRYLDKRVQSLRSDVDNDVETTIIGIHVRRGDNHPFEFQYRESYIPLDTYLSAAEQLLHRTSTSPSTSPSKNKILLASDDPDVYISPDLNPPETKPYTTHKAQRYISLASKSALDTATSEPGNGNAPTTGWEGGFFSALFWSLGSSSSSSSTNRSPATGPAPSQYSLSSPKEEVEETTPSETMQRNVLRLRELVARAYLLDLAVLDSVSDGVVCGVSSAGCRILGVMMGWDAILNGEKYRRGEDEGGGGWFKFSWGGEKKKKLGNRGKKVWRNVDGGLKWRGVI